MIWKTQGWIKSLFLTGCLVAKLFPTFCDPQGLEATRLLCPWDFPGKNTRVGCHFFLQGTLPTQKSNLHLLHWQADSLPLSHLGSHESRIQQALNARQEQFVSFTLLMTLTFEVRTCYYYYYYSLEFRYKIKSSCKVWEFWIFTSIQCS